MQFASHSPSVTSSTPPGNQRDIPRSIQAYRPEEIIVNNSNQLPPHAITTLSAHTKALDSLGRPSQVKQCAERVGYVLSNRCNLREGTVARMSAHSGTGPYSGSLYSFPYSEWGNVHAARARDIYARIVDQHMDIVYPDEESARFVVEIDLSKQPTVTEVQVLHYCGLAIQVVRMFYRPGHGLGGSLIPHDLFDAIVSVMLHHPTMKEPSACSATNIGIAGIQLVFPNIIVRLSSAKQMTAAIQQAFRAIMVVNNIVLDKYDCVTMSQPAFARKTITCPWCLGDEEIRHACLVCARIGKIISPSFYSPYAYHSLIRHSDEKGTWKQIRPMASEAVLFQILEMTSMAPPIASFVTAGYDVPVSVPSWTPSAQGSPKNRNNTSSSSSHYSTDVVRPVYKTGKLLVDPSTLAQVKSIIRRQHEKYNLPDLVLEVRVSRARAVVMIQTTPADRFCQIFGQSCGSEHVSTPTTSAVEGKYHSQQSSIYFVINFKTKTCSQRCHQKECSRYLKTNPGAVIERKLLDVSVLETLRKITKRG